MARTSTPLSCLTLCSLLFAAALAEQPACASGSTWVAVEAEQPESQGLQLLQANSRKVSAARRAGGEDALQDNAWQCHTYENGQDDDWCAVAGVEGDYEYSFESNTGLCGDCWCCKRSVQQLVSSPTEATDLDGPAWQCHNFDGDQDNDWCIEMASNKDKTSVEDDFEYSWTGGKVELRGCGDCWCCKRSAAWRVETSGLLMTKRETSLLSDASVSKSVSKESQQAQEQLALWRASQWQCYEYNEEQDNNWCIGMVSKNLHEFEFAYTDGKVDLCGDCWCCRRTKISALGLVQVDSGHVAALDSSHAEARSGANQPAGADWQCHNYESGQNDDWCMSAGTQGGFEYSFKSGQCGDCWCCKRTVEEIAPPPTTDNAPSDSAPPVSMWQCHGYNNEENDEWCIAKANAGDDADFDYAYTGGEVDLCGDCWCCKRGKTVNFAEKAEDVSKKLQDEQSSPTTVKESDAQSSVTTDKESDWACHTYTTEQNDDWCMSAGVQGGVEYAFNGGKSNQCGDCWCCKREVKPWECHRYDEQQNQNNDWCASTKQFGGYEFAYTGGETNLCGDCWCCKRERA